MTNPISHTWVLLLVCCASARGAEGDPALWHVGFGRADITPDRPVLMAGYASRDKPSEGVESRLFAKAMAVRDPDGNAAVLVTTDLIGIYPYVTGPAVEAVKEKTGLASDQFLFTASHTHAGPALIRDPDAPGTVPEEHRGNAARYTQELQEKLKTAILGAWGDLKPARLSWGVGVAPFVMNRREFTDRGVILGTNPRGPADRSVPVLRIDAPDGTLRGVVFGCACHNTTLGGQNYRISGDYAGAAQTHLEERLPGTQAMFVTGCAGDANPYPRGGDDEFVFVRQHGQTLATEVGRVLEAELRPVRGPLRIAVGTARLPFQAGLTREDLERLAVSRQSAVASNAKDMLERLGKGEKLPDHQEAPVAVWRFDDELTLVALSGEVVVDYVYDIERAIGHRNLWVAAYAHDVFGYVTSARVQREGGYEAKGIAGRGLFAPEAEEAYVAKVRELAGAVGRGVED